MASDAAEVFRKHGDNVAGFALVIWGSDGGSTCDAQVADGSSIPTILVPDFVRNRLLAQRIEQWTLDDFREGG